MPTSVVVTIAISPRQYGSARRRTLCKPLNIHDYFSKAMFSKILVLVLELAQANPKTNMTSLTHERDILLGCSSIVHVNLSM